VTVADIWIYLFLSFFLGLGLGWWLFAGRMVVRHTVSSAETARERARPDPEPAPVPQPAALPAESSAGVMQPIPSEALISLRQQLEQAREARKGAEGLASRLDQQRRAALARESDARSRQETLAARLEQARGDRDHLRAEVEAARRTINRLEDASIELPSAQLEPEAAPDPPMNLQGPRVQASPPVPAPSASSLQHSPSVPKRTVTGSSEGLDQVSVQPAAAKKKRSTPKSRGPVEVLFGPLSGVPVTPNTRSIPFELTARIKLNSPREAAVEDLHIYLRYDLEDEGVAINGRRRGPLTLYKGSAISRTRPVIVQLGVSTGFHSDTPDANRPAAVTGDHRIVIMVEYQVVGAAESTTARFAAAIPVTARSA